MSGSRPIGKGARVMTEFEKKQNGQIYDARDPELRKQQSRAKNLAITYNLSLIHI